MNRLSRRARSRREDQAPGTQAVQEPGDSDPDNPATSRRRRRERTGSLADLLPISLTEPDGLMVTTDGRYVRVIQCDRVPNAVTAGEDTLGQIQRSYQALCQTLPDRQALMILAQTDPIPIDDALAGDLTGAEANAARDREEGNEELAQARMLLYHATRQTVIANAAAAQPAVTARWWVVVPYRPRIEEPRQQVRQAAASARGRTLASTHREAAIESRRLTETIEAVLRGLEIETWRLDGTQALALLWERLHPGAEHLPEFHQLAECCQIASATNASDAADVRHQTLAAIAGDTDLDLGESPSWIRHPDGTLEEIIHLAHQPAATDPAWLSYLLTCPLPSTLAVHIKVGGRERVKAAQRRRWSRLRSTVRYKERRDKLVGTDEEDALDEAAVIDAELRNQVGATIYDVSIYCSIRDPAGDTEAFQRTVKQTCQAFHSVTNAKVVRGRHLALDGFASTLPLGHDALGARRRYAQRNIADCIALTSSRCGCPDGLIGGTADPGGTIERLNPYDPEFPTSLTLLTGKGGGGKTVATNLLALRFVAQGGRLFITDRSSTPAASGDTAGSGHYDMLLAVVPGSRRVQLGASHGDVICPWDVLDPAEVPDQKVEFLLALHALLVGHAQDAKGLTRTLDSDEEALLRAGISHVYAHCAAYDDRPREQLLIDSLKMREDSRQLSGQNADKLESLLLRLEPYAEDGPLAHIADRPTTVPDDAPIVLFDFTGISDRLTPALTLSVADWVEARVYELHRRVLADEFVGLGPLAGRAALIIEEGWKPLESPAAGSWINEFARRARHYELWLIFVTQFFRDFDSEQGRALLANYAIAICLRNDRPDLEFAASALQLTSTDIAEILSLQTVKGKHSTAYMISKRGRGALRLAPAPPEYWIASSNPRTDQPVRRDALAQTGGDPRAALELLCDPVWQAARSRRQQQPTAP